MKTKKMKRLLSILLCIAVMVSLTPTVALGEGNVFTVQPSFARIDDNSGTVSFTVNSIDWSVQPKLIPADGNQDSEALIYFSNQAMAQSGEVSKTAVSGGQYRIAVKYGDTWYFSDTFEVNYVSNLVFTTQPTDAKVAIGGIFYPTWEMNFEPDVVVVEKGQLNQQQDMEWTTLSATAGKTGGTVTAQVGELTLRVKATKGGEIIYSNEFNVSWEDNYEFSVIPNSIDWGTVDLAASYAEKTAVITNIGTKTIYLEKGSQDGFNISIDNQNAGLAPGDNTTLRITPANNISAGIYSFNLLLKSTDGEDKWSMNLPVSITVKAPSFTTVPQGGTVAVDSSYDVQFALDKAPASLELQWWNDYSQAWATKEVLAADATSATVPAEASEQSKQYRIAATYNIGYNYIVAEEFTVTWAEPTPTYFIQLFGHDITNADTAGGKLYLETDAGSAENNGTLYVTGYATENTDVEINAVVDDGYEFVEWRLSGPTGSTLTTNASHAFTATEQLWLYAIFQEESVQPTTYNVVITPGSGMSTTGDADQTVEQGSQITSVVYTAADGYYFPDNYSVAAQNGISVTRDSYTQITVSGTPTAAVNMTLTDAAAKTKENAPSAVFTATGPDTGTLSGVAAGMKYSTDGGNTWTDIASDADANLTGLSACTISVVKKGNGNTTTDSDAQNITVTKADAPTTVVGTGCITDANNDGKLQNVTTDMQYKFSTANDWTDGTGSDITGLVNGTYYVRIKADGTVLASDYQTVQIAAYNVPALTETASAEISGLAKFDETLTANVTNSYNSGTLSYQWKRGNTDIGTNSSTYIVTADDIGSIITVTVSSDVQSGSVTSTATEVIEKADGPAAPSGLTGHKPGVQGASDGKIVGTDASMEYSTDSNFQNPEGTACAANETAGLTSGTYYVRVKETPTHKAGAAAAVAVPEGDAPLTYSITLSPSGNQTFAAATAGYGAQTAKTITVNNTGTGATGSLTVTLSGSNADSFQLNKETLADIAAGGSDTFTVVPKTGLAAAAYSATITVSGGNNINASFDVSFTVNSSGGNGGVGGYVPTVQKPTIEAGEGVKITLSADGKVAAIEALEGYEISSVKLNGAEKGIVAEIKDLRAGDQLVVTAKAVEAEPDYSEVIAALGDYQLVARSRIVTMKNGRKAVKITWQDGGGKELDFDGVEIFRSTQRYKGYGSEPIFDTGKDAYFNTAVKAGIKYYYKVRGYIEIDGQRYYTEDSLKAIRTVK